MPEVNDERREYFRIDDEVYLKYRIVDDEALTEQPVDHKLEVEGGANLGLTLQTLASQSSNLLSTIRKNQAEIAQYLTLLERRIELLSQAVMSETIGADTQPNTPVDLSGSGVSFRSSTPLKEGELLAVEMMLFPSHVFIHAYARVIASNSDMHPRRPFRIGLIFEQITEEAREALIKHTIELQSARLRRERERLGKE